MNLKSPCLKCDVHLKKLSKLSQHVCQACEARLAYADAVAGIAVAAGFEPTGCYRVAPPRGHYARQGDVDRSPASDWTII